MPASSEEFGSELVNFCTGTDHPVAPATVAASESSVKTLVASES
jgi:hypothetical protein